jgi:hypothetical protein
MGWENVTRSAAPACKASSGAGDIATTRGENKITPRATRPESRKINKTKRIHKDFMAQIITEAIQLPGWRFVPNGTRGIF